MLIEDANTSTAHTPKQSSEQTNPASHDERSLLSLVLDLGNLVLAETDARKVECEWEENLPLPEQHTCQRRLGDRDPYFPTYPTSLTTVRKTSKLEPRGDAAVLNTRKRTRLLSQGTLDTDGYEPPQRRKPFDVPTRRIIHSIPRRYIHRRDINKIHHPDCLLESRADRKKPLLLDIEPNVWLDAPNVSHRRTANDPVIKPRSKAQETQGRTYTTRALHEGVKTGTQRPNVQLRKDTGANTRESP